jgi:hypothetical protein
MTRANFYRKASGAASAPWFGIAQETQARTSSQRPRELHDAITFWNAALNFSISWAVPIVTRT